MRPSFGLAGRVSFVLVFTTAIVVGQRTWVVDPENRAGTDFVTLAPAVAASAPGDTIAVRGSPTQLSMRADCNKGITIVGEGVAHALFDWLTVYDLPAGQHFVIRDFGLLAYSSAGVAMYNCAGTVHVQNLRCFPYWPGQSSQLRLYARNCRHVTLRGCETYGGNGGGLDLTSSTVVATECVFWGNMSHLSGSLLVISSLPAASVALSELTAVDCDFRGGNGWVDVTCSTVAPNNAGILMASSRVVVAGTSAVRGGNTPNSSVCWVFQPAPCAVGTGTLEVGPGIPLLPPPSGPVLVYGSAQYLTRSSLAASGGDLQVRVEGWAGALAATFVSLPGPVTALAQSGSLWLDPGLMSLIDLATIDGSGQRTVLIRGLTVPEGVPLAFQTALLSLLGVRLTVPSVTIVGR